MPLVEQLAFLPKLEDAQVIAFAIALISSLFLTPIVKERATKLNMLDKPGGRHIHQNPIPRLGGIAVYISLLITSLLFIIIYGRYTPGGFEHFELLGVLGGGTLIFFLGLLDDVHPLPSLTKLMVQIFASVVAFFSGVQVNYLANPLFFLNLANSRVIELDLITSFVITVAWLVLITNALNLIDGLDGLAGGVALIASMSLWAILLDEKIAEPAGALLSATLGGSVLGFLRSNYNPARIFLGDSGAYFLGFMLGAISVASLSEEPNTATVGSVVVIAFSFPLFDTCFAIIRRFLKGKPVMQADADHLHHRILRAGLSTKETMFVIYLTCGLLGLVAATITGAHKRYSVLLLMTMSLGLLSGFWHRESDKTPKTDDKKNI